MKASQLSETMTSLNEKEKGWLFKNTKILSSVVKIAWCFIDRLIGPKAPQ